MSEFILSCSSLYNIGVLRCMLAFCNFLGVLQRRYGRGQPWLPFVAAKTVITFEFPSTDYSPHYLLKGLSIQ